MSESKEPAQASIEDQLAEARNEIQRLWGESFARKVELRERIFHSLYRPADDPKYVIEKVSEIVAFILGEDRPAPDLEMAQEIIDCHKYLDSVGILREGSPGNPFCLEGRIKLLAALPNLTLQVIPDRALIPLEDCRQFVETQYRYFCGQTRLSEERVLGAKLALRDFGTWLGMKPEVFDAIGSENVPQLQVTPDSPMIPLEDLRKWINAHTPEMGMGLGGNVGDFSKRRFLQALAKDFGLDIENLAAGGNAVPPESQA